MKKVARKLIVVLFIITLLFSVFTIISKRLIKNNFNIATLEKSDNLAIYPDNNKYSLTPYSDVEKIHYANDTTNYGWCMDKGANLYGGVGHVSGEADGYATNNAREGSLGNIQWLLDNMLRLGDNVSSDENGWYRNNLQRILGNNAQISDYSDDEIFRIEQWVLWHFTNNVTGDSALSYPTGDPLYNALYNAAKEKQSYTRNTNQVSINSNNAIINSNGTVGPFTVSNNNVMNLTATLNSNDTTIYTDAECTQELSKYNDYNGDVYIKVSDINNVNITFNWSSFNTTAKYYTTTGNGGDYRDQSFIMIERTKNQDSVTFSKTITGSFDLDLIKYVKGTTIPLEGAEFKVSIKDENGKELADTNKTYKTGNDGHFSEKISGINIEGENKKYTVTITETKIPDGYEGIIGNIVYTDVESYKTTDGKYALKAKESTTVANAKKVTVKEDEVLIEAENTPEGPHKGVKEVYNQDSGYYSQTGSKTAENELNNDFVIATDAKNAARVLNEDELKVAINNSNFSEQAKQNVLDVIPDLIEFQDKYKINALFLIAVAKTESNCGTAWDLIDSSTHNWLSIKDNGGYIDRNGESWGTYQNFSEATEACIKLITDSDFYFKAEKYSVKQIAPIYCNEEWGEQVYKWMKELYECLGAQSNNPSDDFYHDWVITSRIPNGIDKYGKYIITDTIDERLEFAGLESVKVTLLDGRTLEKTKDLTKDTDYKVDYDEATKTLKLSFIEGNFVGGRSLSVGSIVEIRFNTIFAKDEDGNIIAINQSVPNQATLEYDNNNKLYTEIPEVHTGGVGLYKYDKNTGKALEGAKFKIATSKENAENGIFVKDANGKDIEKVTNEKGIAVFEGLEFGEDAMDEVKYQTGENIYGKPIYKYDWEKVETTYYVVETDSPTGYSKIEEVIEAVVKKDNYNINDVETLIKIGNESDIYDLALRKFITAVKDGGSGEEKEVTTRIPDVDIANLVDGTSTTATYTHPKDPVLVHTTDTVTYTIRIFNEGPQDAYASIIKDDIPEGLQFIQYTQGDGSINDIYRWKLVDENDNEVTDITKAKYIITDYLAMNESESNLIKGFNPETMTELDYRDVQVQFKVVEPTTSDRILINYAQISEETDRNGNKVTDRDSTPNEWKGEDDEDIEKVRVLYFDLALRKWVTQAIVTENGQTYVTETGHKAEDDPEEVVKVDLKRSKLDKVTVKFRYSIRITNEGELAGEATEIRDDIPNGLKFVAEDNPDWREEDGKIVTNKLAGTTLQPGESAEVEIILTWVNSKDNMGVMVNTAEISKDHNEYGTPDIDSTPGNYVPGEDDIDDAPVMLTIKTGSEIIMYTTLTLGFLAIIVLGTSVIKRTVL